MKSLREKKKGGDTMWEGTMHTVLPWAETPAILRNLPVVQETISGFFLFDVWHNFHLRIAKHRVACSLVAIAESNILAQSSMEDKFQAMTDVHVDFCRSQKVAMWITEISRGAAVRTSKEMQLVLPDAPDAQADYTKDCANKKKNSCWAQAVKGRSLLGHWSDPTKRAMTSTWSDMLWEYDLLGSPGCQHSQFPPIKCGCSGEMEQGFLQHNDDAVP